MRTLFIEDKEKIDAIIKACRTCYLGLSINNQPYVVPMNFGYDGEYIYLHSGQEGRKWETMKQNPKACITFCLGDELAWQDEHVACSWRVKSQTIIAEGVLEFIDDMEEKEEIMHIFMKNYSDREFKFNKPAIKNVGIFKMKTDGLKAKEFGVNAITPRNK
ncbi:MAG TPA: pyridoxamine 5'-phosphate oxidase family protein [Prolixibacteraceae bacterium]|nr:pyridoxamine 5'-phosphate oxidase family protein [Prolixibacteraceae bacterium]